jgi:hypothetical protein
MTWPSAVRFAARGIDAARLTTVALERVEDLAEVAPKPAGAQRRHAADRDLAGGKTLDLRALGLLAPAAVQPAARHMCLSRCAHTAESTGALLRV